MSEGYLESWLFESLIHILSALDSISKHYPPSRAGRLVLNVGGARSRTV